MNTKRLFLFFASAFLINTLFSQTIVKMDMPPLADEPLNVVALFDEELPEDIPVVLGLMGYDVAGGVEPYIFEWILNGEVISTSDIAIFTPTKGDDLVLKVTDNNKCRASTAFNLKVGHVTTTDTGKDHILVYPTVFSNELFIYYPENQNDNALIRIFDLKGVMVFQKNLTGSSRLLLNLDPGTYLISVKTATLHEVEKIIAN